MSFHKKKKKTKEEKQHKLVFVIVGNNRTPKQERISKQAACNPDIYNYRVTTVSLFQCNFESCLDIKWKKKFACTLSAVVPL